MCERLQNKLFGSGIPYHLKKEEQLGPNPVFTTVYLYLECNQVFIFLYLLQASGGKEPKKQKTNHKSQKTKQQTNKKNHQQQQKQELS